MGVMRKSLLSDGTGLLAVCWAEVWRAARTTTTRAAVTRRRCMARARQKCVFVGGACGGLSGAS